MLKRQVCIKPIEMEVIESKQRLDDKFEFYSMAENDIINQKIEELDEQVS